MKTITFDETKWKLVPIEPTRAMWSAVNKLDDEMAAGSYDGKGCSIEQAWNCMLDFAPDAPPPAPAQEVGLTDEERQQVFRDAETRMVREINLSWRTAVVDEVIAAICAKEQA